MKQVLLLSMILFVLSCNDETSYTRQQLERMLSSRIEIPVNDLIVWGNGNNIQCANAPEYTLVVYIDSFACTTCMMKSLYLWNHLLGQIHDAGQQISTVFIMSVPESNGLDDLKTSFDESGLEHSIFVDTASCFQQINPQIPNNPLFHTFLINKNDSVVLVGDPLRNEQIKEMMFGFVGIETGSK